jgi:hypothetical protein
MGTGVEESIIDFLCGAAIQINCPRNSIFVLTILLNNTSRNNSLFEVLFSLGYLWAQFSIWDNFIKNWCRSRFSKLGSLAVKWDGVNKKL